MKYYLIVGEASGDLHASHLMAALKEEDPEAEFRFFGGDLMAAVGGTMVKHYKELAYMGFIPVLLHLPTIFANMKRCKEDIVAWSPDVLILVDYPAIITIFAVLMCGIWFTAVYSSHHYIIDVLLGITCALLGILFFEKGLMKIPGLIKFFNRYQHYIEA